MIELLCGMIASGKSTYARERAREGCVIVSDDAIVNAMHADQYDQYDPDLKPLYKAVQSCMILTAIAMGRTVVVDRTHLCPASRARIVALASSVDVPIRCIHFPIVAEASHYASRRFHTDARGIPLSKWQAVAERHLSEYVEPSLAEGFTDIEKIIW